MPISFARLSHQQISSLLPAKVGYAGLVWVAKPSCREGPPVLIDGVITVYRKPRGCFILDDRARTVFHVTDPCSRPRRLESGVVLRLKSQTQSHLKPHKTPCSMSSFLLCSKVHTLCTPVAAGRIARIAIDKVVICNVQVHWNGKGMMRLRAGKPSLMKSELHTPFLQCSPGLCLHET